MLTVNMQKDSPLKVGAEQGNFIQISKYEKY